MTCGGLPARHDCASADSHPDRQVCEYVLRDVGIQLAFLYQEVRVSPDGVNGRSAPLNMSGAGDGAQIDIGGSRDIHA